MEKTNAFYIEALRKEEGYEVVSESKTHLTTRKSDKNGELRKD